MVRRLYAKLLDSGFEALADVSSIKPPFMKWYICKQKFSFVARLSFGAHAGPTARN